MASTMIESVHIQGFRSLADVELAGIPKAAVLIGANGSGKSNFIRFFEMLSWMLRSRRLGEFVERQGGADDQLFGGSRVTPRMKAEISLLTATGQSHYRFALSHTQTDRFLFTEEGFRFSRPNFPTEANWQYLDSGHREAKIVEAAQTDEYPEASRMTAKGIVHLLRNIAAYQFHDTSYESNFKKKWDVYDNHQLRSDGGNLAAVLYRLEQEDVRVYEDICWQIGRVLPGFDRFAIEEKYGKVLLRWKAKWSDKTFGAHVTSDGSLRAFALVTLLRMPTDMLPDVVLLDEPELGLHTSAVGLIGGMIASRSHERQIIVATQSPHLVDTFDIDQVFVMDLKEGQTLCRKLDPDAYKQWIEHYSIGELWEKNILGGRP